MVSAMSCLLLPDLDWLPSIRDLTGEALGLLAKEVPLVSFSGWTPVEIESLPCGGTPRICRGYPSIGSFHHLVRPLGRMGLSPSLFYDSPLGCILKIWDHFNLQTLKKEVSRFTL